MFSRLKKESEALIQGIIQLVYFMRGSIQYHDMFELTPAERDLMDNFLAKRLEAEGKNPHPQY
jgi:hypothetical protein